MDIKKVEHSSTLGDVIFGGVFKFFEGDGAFYMLTQYDVGKGSVVVNLSNGEVLVDCDVRTSVKIYPKAALHPHGV